MPITQIHCLDEAIKACGGTWNRPEILIQIEKARNNLEIAKDTSELILCKSRIGTTARRADFIKASKLNHFQSRWGSSCPAKKSREIFNKSSTDQRISQIRTIMSKIQSKYQLGVSNLQAELSATLQRLEEQKDILSSEQLEIERLRIQNEKLALDNANKQRVVEVTKELEQKLAARGFEIRKRMIGKKIVYQAVRR